MVGTMNDEGPKRLSSMPDWPSSQENLDPTQSQATLPTQLIPCDLVFYQNRRRKNNRRRKRNTRHRSNENMDHDSVTSPPLRAVVRVGDEPRMRRYYEKAFEAFQQANCRVIAKAFVKFIEPRKQANHPYNGRLAMSGVTGNPQFDPELTKPKWWPTGVTHKEPDHLQKDERIRLLVHILCELGNSHGVTAPKLREAGQDFRRQIEPSRRLKVLDEIYTVREAEERYLRGEIDKDCRIYISEVQLPDPEFEFEYRQVTDTAVLQNPHTLLPEYKTDTRFESTAEGGIGVLFPHQNEIGHGMPFNPAGRPYIAYDHDTSKWEEKQMLSLDIYPNITAAPYPPFKRLDCLGGSSYFHDCDGKAVPNPDCAAGFLSVTPQEVTTDSLCLPWFPDQPPILSSFGQPGAFGLWGTSSPERPC